MSRTSEAAPFRQCPGALEIHAREWIAWARAPGLDSYDVFHRDVFFRLVPQPGRLTLDIGCGEGRVSRDLAARGHTLIAIDAAPTLVAAAREAAPSMDVRLADAALLPLDDASVDLAVAFMSLHDVDDLDGAIREIARVLEPGGRLCMAIVHPLNSAGAFEGERPGSPFTLRGAYLRPGRYAYEAERSGHTMKFHCHHRPLEHYFRGLEEAGLVTEKVRETGIPEASIRAEAERRWQRIPLFLHILARRP